MTTTATEFDLSALVAAIEADDPDAQAALYADAAEVQVQNRDHGPGAPLVISGREAVHALLKDVASRKLEHRVLRAVSDGSTGALQVSCRYPDGALVTCSSAFDVEGGRIVRETRLEAWDA